MNFKEAKKNSYKNKLTSRPSSSDECLYQYAINFYNEPPIGKISLDEAEDYVAERLEILQVLDSLRNHSSITDAMRREKNFFELLDERLKKAPCKFGKNFYELSKSTNDEAIKSRKRDHISHFLLCLYYCTKDELKKWFITNECELFRMRLMNEAQNVKTLREILIHNGFNYEEVKLSEKNKEIDCMDWKSEIKQKPENAVVYRIPFEEALDLVKYRRVFLKNGYAYIMASEIVSIVCHRFRINLSQSLAIMSHALPQLEENERLVPRLSAMHDHYIQQRKTAIKSENSGRESITPDMINTLAKESFPPCMKNIHESLRKEHHLRHYGRLHYGLFLKSIGLSLDDALEFFRNEFTQKAEITPERFQRDYAYNIRYNYGKEGKKLNISGYSCAKIINNNPPGPADTHGCPFKHFDTNNLKAFLKRNAIDETATEDIMQSAVEEKSCGMACSKFFAFKHPWYPKLEQNIYHPNQYYVESRKALKMSLLTPPNTQEDDDTGKTNTFVGNTTLEESMFEDDEFDRTMASGKFDLSFVSLDGLSNGQENLLNQTIKEENEISEENEQNVGEKEKEIKVEIKSESNQTIDDKMIVEEKEDDKEADQVEMDI